MATFDATSYTPLDISPVAALNAQLAGVLAGLAFTVLLIYLQNKNHEDEQVHGGVAQSLCAAFIALLLCAINYGTVTASPQGTPQGIVLLTMHVPVFGLSILLLIYAIALASVSNLVMEGAVKLCTILVVPIGPPVIIANVMLAFYDMHGARCAVKCAESSLTPVYVSAWLTSGLVLYGVVLMIWMYKKRPRDYTSARRYGVVGWMVVWATLLDFIGHAYLSLRGLYFWPNNLTQTIGVICMTLSVGVFMTLCARVLPPLRT